MKTEPRTRVADVSPDVETFRYDPTADRSLAIAIVEAVSTVSGTDPMELSPLYSAIDPDVVDSLFEGETPDAPPDDWRLAFEYESLRVRVDGDGLIAIE